MVFFAEHKPIASPSVELNDPPSYLYILHGATRHVFTDGIALLKTHTSYAEI